MHQATSVSSLAAVWGTYLFRQPPPAAPAEQEDAPRRSSDATEPRGAFLTGKKLVEAAWENRWRSVAVAIGCQMVAEMVRRRTRRLRKGRVEGTSSAAKAALEAGRCLRVPAFEHITSDADAAGGGDAIAVGHFDRTDNVQHDPSCEVEERAAGELMCKLAAAHEEGRRDGLLVGRLEGKESEKAKLRSEREEMERQMLELRQRITSVCSERQRLATRLARATSEFQRKHAAVQPLEVARRKADEELCKARTEIASLRDELAVLRQTNEDYSDRLKKSEEVNAHLKKARTEIASLRDDLSVLRQTNEDYADRLKISEEVNAQLKKEKSRPWGGLVQLRASPRPRQGTCRTAPVADTSDTDFAGGCSTEGALSADDGAEGVSNESCTPTTSVDVSGSSKATTPRGWGGTGSRTSSSPRADSEVAHFQQSESIDGESEVDEIPVASQMLQPGKVLVRPQEGQTSVAEAVDEHAASPPRSPAHKKFVVISPRVGLTYPASMATPRTQIGSEPSVWTRAPVDNSLIVDAIKAVPKSDGEKMRNKMAMRRALLESKGGSSVDQDRASFGSK